MPQVLNSYVNVFVGDFKLMEQIAYSSFQELQTLTSGACSGKMDFKAKNCC